MREDLKLALRSLNKAPGFSVVVVFTLAVAIGANSAIFSVVNGVLLKPLPFDEPERLVGVWHTAPGLGIPTLNASASTYFTYREEGRVFDRIGLWDNSRVTITGLGEPERVEALRFTEEVFPMLRVPPLEGRAFTAADMEVGSPDTVILSYAYWQRRFGGSKSAIGAKLMVDNRAAQVVGIMPAHFRFLDEPGQVFLPLQFKRSEVFVGQFNNMGIARLKPGVTLQQANADIARMIPLVEERFPLPPGLSKQMLESAKMGPKVRPLKEDAVGDVGNVLWVLMGVAGVVLLIACANVANLLLVRAEGRQQEMAIRTALGADWKRIARQLTVESVVLGLAGGVAGIALAWMLIRLLIRLEPSNIPRLGEIAIDPIVVTYTLAVSILSGLMIGLIPVFKYATAQMALALRENNRSASAGRQHHRTRRILVVSQVAMALVLLITSGLMLRTFQSLRQVEPGFRDPASVLTFRVSIPEGLFADQAQVAQAYERIAGQLRTIPGVTSVGLSSSVTMDGSQNNDPIFVEDFPGDPGKLPALRRYKFIGPGTFQTVGNPILAGRDITWADIHGLRPVVLISENLAREFWKDPAKAIGRRIRETPASGWREIIGVVGDERDSGVHRPAPTIVYWPLLLNQFWREKMFAQTTMAFQIRSSRVGTPALLKDVQTAVWSVNPGLPVANVRTMEQIRARSMARTSFTLLMLALASGVALLLGIVGIYGVISYAVSQRTREIGIRMALGAQQRQVSSLFVREGALLICAGLAIGLAAAAGVTRTMEALLFGVGPVDPWTYAIVSTGLACAALAACYLPARRATMVDPSLALRSE